MASMRELLVFLLLTLSVVAQGYEPVRNYDPNRNGASDLAAAQSEARRSNRNVLIEVGGQWCIWCHFLDKFFETHEEIKDLRDQYYVTVPINYSKENKNKKLLSRFPEVAGFPHLYVLDGDGKLIQSQDTSELEQGEGYNPEKMKEFLLKWAPISKTAQSPPAS